MEKHWGAVASIAFRVCDITCVLINRRFNKKLPNIPHVVSFVPILYSIDIRAIREAIRWVSILIYSLRYLSRYYDSRKLSFEQVIMLNYSILVHPGKNKNLFVCWSFRWLLNKTFSHARSYAKYNWMRMTHLHLPKRLSPSVIRHVCTVPTIRLQLILFFVIFLFLILDVNVSFRRLAVLITTGSRNSGVFC